ncbi:MAG: substrate-binding domain-containing protein [Oscillospiraceae bacterium]
MKKFINMLLIGAILISTLAGCANQSNESTSESINLDSKKIAIIRNLIEDDHTTQFIAGATEQGEAEGYKVDSFISGGDDEKTKTLIKDAIKNGYGGIILSHGKQEYSTDLLTQAIEKGIKVVTFDTIFEKQIPSITQTMQNDSQLAELSLGALIENIEAPANIVKIWYSGGMRPFDLRNEIYTQMELDGKIKTIGEVNLRNLSNVQADVESALSKILQSGEKIDGVWAAWDEMAKGALTTLNKANKTDIKLVSIDISEKDKELMEKNSTVWTATAAVDAHMIGAENMKLVIKKLKGKETNPRVVFDGKLYKIIDGKVKEQ